MRAALGSIGVIAALSAAVLGALTLAAGLRTRRASVIAAGYRCLPIMAGGALVAVAAMEWALLTHDFSIKYVAENNATTTSTLFTITGLWASLEGSILLWGLVLVGYTLAVYHRFRARRDDPLVAWAVLVMLGVCVFFFALMMGPANPFRTLAFAPDEGNGPNPLLQNHPLMAFHPPILYLGYIGFTVPFAFAVAALVTGRLGEGWLAETRRWTVLAWGCLSLGIVLGAWWSYEVLGWGGYWAWDPVENASLLPWLTGTAFIHSVMVQERRGMLRVWNLSLVMATFALTILGTFLTRSGVLQSVHAFSESGIGPWLIGFFAVIVALTVGLIGWRGDRLRSPGAIDSPLSREGAFMANNLLFAVFAFVVLLGTVFPLVVESLNDDRLSVGRPYFDRMSMPIGLTLLFMMAVAPALPWRKAAGSVLRDRLQWPAAAGVAVMVGCAVLGARGWSPVLTFGLGAFAGAAALRQLVLAARAARRRGEPWVRGLTGRANGGMVVHLGVVLVAVAVAASGAYASKGEFSLKPGQTATVGGQTVTFLERRDSDLAGGRRQIKALVRVPGGGVYSPAFTRYSRDGNWVGTPSVKTGLTRDLYLTIAGEPGEDGTMVLGVAVNPMILWLWTGGLLIGLGTLLSLVPGRRRRPTDPSTRAHAEVAREDDEPRDARVPAGVAQ